MLAARTVFLVLSSSVNKIWRSQPTDSGSILHTLFSFAVNQLLAFLLVLGTGFLLLTSLISNIVIRTILKWVVRFQEIFAFIQIDELRLSQGLQSGSTFLILALAICILFKILPSVYVAWRDVWLAAILTTLLLMGLQQLVSNSVITIGGQFFSYGVIGSVMILMLWIFLACQIFLGGCVLAYVYAHLWGSEQHRGTNRC